MVNTYSRYVPVLDPRFSYRGEDVVSTLEQVGDRIGYGSIRHRSSPMERQCFLTVSEAIDVLYRHWKYS